MLSERLSNLSRSHGEWQSQDSSHLNQALNTCPLLDTKHAGPFYLTPSRKQREQAKVYYFLISKKKMYCDIQVWIEFLGDVPPNADLLQLHQDARPGDLPPSAVSVSPCVASSITRSPCL